jgi:UDP-N-acetylmuramoylalanine--D-glutamate ligase
MGLGSFGGGIGAAKFLAERGARVTVTDLKQAEALARSVAALDGYGIRFVLGRHETDDFTGADIVVASPAAPRESPYLDAARRAGARLTTEINLFVERCPAPVCGVTGSNGKTTTVSMIGGVLAASGLRGFVGGNIGGSLLAELPRIAPDDRVVLELSSFQIEWLDEIGFSPRLAALLNIVPNHLDRHGTFAAYADIKGKLFDHQSGEDTAVIVWDDAGARAMASRVRGKLVRAGRTIDGDGFTVEGNHIVRRSGKTVERILDTGRLLVPGAHNVLNALAAAACSYEMGAPSEGIAEGLTAFRGAPHRLEFAGEAGGVRFYNDSKATTPEAAAVGVAAFSGGVVPIFGGYDKGASFDSLARNIAGKVRWAALIGVTAPAIGSALASAGIESTVFGSLEEAFRACVARARPGEVVLLSPGCASYDMFANYEERGETFRALVRALASGKT